MRTDSLIDRLADGLTPVRPLRPPGVRAAWWILGAISYLAVLAFAWSGFRLAPGNGDIGFLIVQLVGVIAGILAAIGAFASVVPGFSNRVQVWPLVATIAWLAAMIVSSLGAGENQAILAAQYEWACVAIIVIGGAPLVAALAVMLRRGAPLHPIRTALLGALAVGLLANFGACISRPHAEDAVTLAWHGAAVLALIIICTAGVRFVLRWGEH